MSINNKNKARVDLRNSVEIAEGNKTQKDAKFSPSIIGTVDGASKVKHPDNFHRPEDPRTEARSRVAAYMQDPRNQKITNDFMQAFNNPQFEKA